MRKESKKQVQYLQKKAMLLLEKKSLKVQQAQLQKKIQDLMKLSKQQNGEMKSILDIVKRKTIHYSLKKLVKILRIKQVQKIIKKKKKKKIKIRQLKKMIKQYQRKNLCRQ